MNPTAVATLPVVEHLRRRAAGYFDASPSAPVDVRPVTPPAARHSLLEQYEVRVGTRTYALLVKMPRLDGRRQQLQSAVAADSRHAPPQAALRLNDAERLFREYEAICRLYDYFGQLGDRRFDAIRPLDFLADHCALVTEKLELPNLARGFWRAGRMAWGTRRLLQPLRHCGAWLNQFHQMDGPAKQWCSRNELLADLQQCCLYLAELLSDHPYFERLFDQVRLHAEHLLPSEIPCLIKHGDFALRNVLLSDHGQIVVLDTIAYRTAPIYEDLAYFLTSMKATRPQIYSAGLAFSRSQLRRCEAAFLNGYFNDTPIPTGSIRLFEIRATLDKWISRATHFDQQTKRGKRSARIQQTLLGSFLHNHLKQLMGQLT